MVRPQQHAPPRPGAARPWALRSARSSDAEAWHALQRTIYREGVAFVGDGAPSAGALAAKVRALAADQGLVTFAVASGTGPAPEIVGWIEVQRMAARRLAHVAWLTIAVAPAWRRRGVGVALMQAGRRWAEAQRVRKLQLHVRGGNAPAIELYRLLGYEVEGVLRDQVAVGDVRAPTGFEDEWIMSLDLAGGPA